MLIRRAEIDGRVPGDVRVEAGRVAEIAPELRPRENETLLDAAGGALLPGLHDHHLHLFALAAARRSVRCGPPEVRDAPGLGEALARARRGTPPDAWIRGVGYHESVAGELPRDVLDRWVPDRPLRVQHRSGSLWMLNTPGARRVELDAAEHPGVERDPSGRATGRVFRADTWLRERLGPREVPCLRDVGRELAGYGVTGVTDATPGNGAEELALFAEAASRGDLPQQLLVMGRPGLPEPGHARVARGAVKLVLSEAEPTAFEALCDAIAAAHAESRSVAIHCVTRSELVLAAAAYEAVGTRAGDRVEHAAVAPPETLSLLAALEVTVVTQPNFVAERGEAYLREVARADLPFLYRCRGFVDALVPLGGGTDAPFGDPDPWAAMRAAVQRRAPGGEVLGEEERLTPERALALFTSPPGAPGAAPRRVAVGAPADLCLLDAPWRVVRERLSRERVAATLCAGELVAGAA